MKNILPFILLLLLPSCAKEKEAMHPDAVEIDLTTPADSVCYLSLIADSMAYYPLCVDAKKPGINLGTNYIWAYYSIGHFGNLYKRTTGELINKISFWPTNQWNPYEQHPYIMNAYFLSEEECRIVRKRIEKGTKSYYSSVIFRLTTGEHVDSIDFPMYNFFQLNDSLVINPVTHRDTCPPYPLKWYDTNMNFIKEDTFTDSIFGYYATYPGYEASESNALSLLKDKIYYHPPISKTIYEVSPNHEPIPVYRYKMGKHEPEYSKVLEQKIRHKLYSIDKMNEFPYYLIFSPQISDNYVWTGFYYQTKRYQLLFNRHTHQKWIIPTHRIWTEYDESHPGVVNDLDGGMDFWPKSVSKQGEIYTWYFTDSLKAKVNRTDLSKMKNPEAASKLKKILDELPKEANIVVAVLKEKKL